jgi:hypothetical protein
MKNMTKTKWNFKLFYKNDKDIQINLDFNKFEKAVISFEKKYKENGAYLNNGQLLFSACQD